MPSSASQDAARPTVADRTEAELIAVIASTLPPPPSWLTVGIGDDAAVVEPERNRLDVVTVDTLIDGVHVDRRFTPPDAIGYRALAINLSDLAAMGAAPRYALLSLALPPSMPCEDFEAMAHGLARCATQHRLHVVGGNLTQTPGPLVVDITAVGTVKRRDVLTRGGARPGDEVYVSGAIGSAAAGLAWLRETAAGSGPASALRYQGSDMDASVTRYFYPEPRVRLGLLLGRNRAATACVDLSDGLADGVKRIASASGVGIAIDADQVPMMAAARSWFERTMGDAVGPAVAAGDDYELLFTVRPRLRNRLRAVARLCATTLTRIGTCTKDGAIVLRRTRGEVSSDEPMPPGFRHFS